MAEDVAAGRLHMEAEVDTTGVARGLQRKIDAETRGIKARLQTELAPGGVRDAARRAAIEASRAGKVRFQAELDTRSVIAAARAAALEASRNAVITFRAQVESRSMATAKREIDKVAADRKAAITVEANTARALAKVEALRAAASRNVEMGVNVGGGGAGAMAGIGAAGQQAAAGANAAASGVANFGQQLQKLSVIPAIVGGVYQLGVAAVQGASGLFSMAASASQAVYSLAALPSVIGMAVQGMAALFIGFSGIGEAVGALSAHHMALGQEQVQQAKAAQSNARAEQAAARQVKSAEQAIGDARRQAADATIAARQRVADAEWGVTEAQHQQRQALQDLNDARAEAKQRIIDLDRELIKSRQDEMSAATALTDAQEHLQDVMWNKSSTDREKRDAEDAVRQARQALTDARNHHKDVQKEDAKADKQGVEGADAVKAAKWAVVEANHGMMTSERELANAQRAQRETAIQNAESIANAQQNLAVAQQALADAQKKGAADTAAQSASMLKLQSVMDNMSPVAQRFARFIYGLKPRWDELQTAVQNALLPPIQEGITRALPLLDVLQKGLVGTATVIGQFAVRLGTLMGSKGFGRDVSGIMSTNNKALGIFMDAAFNLIQVLRDLAVVAGPTLLVPFAKWVRAVTKGWQESVHAARETGRLHDTFVRARKGAGLLWDILKNLAQMIHGVGKAATPAGDSLLKSLDKAARGWNKWANSDTGQKKMTRFFNGTKKITRMIGRVLGDLLQVVTKLADTGGGPLMGFLDVLDGALRGLNWVLSQKGWGQGIGWLLTLAGAGAGIAWVAGGLMRLVSALKLMFILEKLQVLWGLFSKSIYGTYIGVKLLTAWEWLAAKATAAWTAVQEAFDLALDANPIGVWVMAIAALVAGLIYAYKHVDWFRAGVQKAVGWITAAFKWLWEGAQKLWDILFGHSIFPDMLKAFSAIFGAIGKVIGLWWKGVQFYFHLVMGAVKVVSKVVGWLWSRVFKPVFKAIGKVVGWVWSHVMKPLFKVWGVEFRIAGAVVRWLYEHIVKPYFNLVGAIISKVWKKVIKPTWDNFVRGVKIIGGWVKDLYNKWIKPRFNDIGNLIENVWKKTIKPAFDALSKFVKTTLPDAFQRGVNGVKTMWDKMKKIAEDPIRFVINTVYNNGLRKMIGALPGVSEPKYISVNFASGTSNFLGRRGRSSGVLPGYSPGRDNLDFVSTDGRMRLGLGGGEGILRPEVVRGLGARAIDLLNGAAAKGRTALNKTIAAMVHGTGDVGAGAPNAPRRGPRIGRALRNALDGPASYRAGVHAMGGILNFAGGGVLSSERISAALKFAHAHDYAGYSMADRVGPNNFDCSGFMGAITNVLQGYSNPYFSRGTTASFRWPGFKPGPGQFTIGSANPYPGSQYGHMAGTLAGTNVESNGSDGVVVGSRARGYNDPGFRIIGHLGQAGKGAARNPVPTPAMEHEQGHWTDAIDSILNAVKSIPGWLSKLRSFEGLGDQIATSFKTFGAQVQQWINDKIPDSIHGPGPIPDLPLPDNPIHFFDRGGPLYPGSTLAVNKSGKTETVFTNENMVDMARYLGQVARALTTSVSTVEHNESGALVEQLVLNGKPSEMPGLLSDATYELRRIRRGGVHANRVARRPARTGDR